MFDGLRGGRLRWKVEDLIPAKDVRVGGASPRFSLQYRGVNRDYGQGCEEADPGLLRDTSAGSGKFAVGSYKKAGVDEAVQIVHFFWLLDTFAFVTMLLGVGMVRGQRSR